MEKSFSYEGKTYFEIPIALITKRFLHSLRSVEMKMHIRKKAEPRHIIVGGGSGISSRAFKVT
jgi:hypothetical protein